MSEAAALLTIAVSTLGERIGALRAWHFDPRVRYLLLWQQPGEVATAWPANVRLLPLSSVGVAHSRNAAIAQCDTPWLWFMDDDVALPPAAIDALLALLPQQPEHRVLITSVVQPDGRPLKRRPEGQRYDRRGVLAVGTIQIVAQADWLRRHGLRFPLRLGAGARYPVCDEPVFLARALRAGAAIVHTDRVQVVHAAESSGGSLARPEAVRARAIAFYEIFGLPLCVAASFYFWLRHAPAIGWRWPALFHYGPAD
jgi:hypothetical protein